MVVYAPWKAGEEWIDCEKWCAWLHTIMARRSSTKPPVKQMMLEKKLRDQIVSGRLAPGERFPIRTVLQRRHRVSAITVQRAFDYLVRTGFAVPRGSLGTFVADRPPHLYRYAIILFLTPGDQGWNRFCKAVTDRVDALSRAGEFDFKVVYCIGGLTGIAHEKLLSEAQEHGFAGLLFVNDPWPIAGSPLLALPMPKATFSMRPPTPALGRIDLDVQGFLNQGMAYLAARGRRQLAVLANLGAPPTELLQATAARHGLDLPTYHLQRSIPGAAEAARGLVHLLCRADTRTRPDAFLICDDNYLEHAIAGILDAGLRPGVDIEVVGHCNFPDPASARLPLRRLGYDTDTLLRAAVALMSEQTRQPRAALETVVPAVFDPEAPNPP